MKLILLPGMDGTGLMFRPFTDVANNRSIEVISYPDDKTQKYSNLKSYVRDRLPKDEDYIVIAESYSGPIAYELMKEDIQNLKAVIFIASFLENPRPLLLSILGLLPISIILRLPIPNFIIRRYLLGNGATDILIAEFRTALSNVSPAVLASRLKEISALKKPDKTVNYPCCYIRAEDDKLVPCKSMEVFRELIPNIHIQSVIGPHFLLQLNPEVCLKVIDEEFGNL